MSQANAGWLFYKKNFFHLIHPEDPQLSLLQSNTELLNIKALDINAKARYTHNFELTTIYPGLIIGAGYSHGIKGEEENFDLGFFFDHTTGMPMLSGSSVKGVLRSIFKRLKNKDERELILAFFSDMFKSFGNTLLTNMEDSAKYVLLKKIEDNIFEGKCENNKQINLYKRDKFFDALIVSGDTDDFILDDDNLAPHHKNVLKEPNVLKFLKVRADVTFDFSFDLHDMYMDNELFLTAKQKEKLFYELIQFTGIGAKTNVGYGQFEVIKKENTSVPEEEPVPKEFNFDSFMNGVEKALNAKSIKTLITRMKKEHTLDDEEKEKLNAVINKRIKDEYPLPDDWSGLTAKKQRAIIGGDYVDAIKNINR